MEQFAPVKRSKDGQPVRYLRVDDSVFARKNLARMIETYGGQVAAEAAGMRKVVKHFSEIDRDNKGYVTMQDLKAWHQERKAEKAAAHGQAPAGAPPPGAPPQGAPPPGGPQY